MIKVKIILPIQIALLSLTTENVDAQNTVFNMMRKDIVIADDHYAAQNYQSALEVYLRIAGKEKADVDLEIKIGRCYYFLRRYDEALKWYSKQFRTGSLPQRDLFYFAETLSSLQEYKTALEAYRKYLERDAENELIIKKIWRLDNIRFLYEDSTHYALKPITTNSESSDIAPVPHNDGLIFLSNRKTLQVVEQFDASTNAPFFRLYFSKKYVDSLSDVGGLQYAIPQPWHLNSDARFHQGPIAFFDNGKKVVFTKSSKTVGENGKRTLQLHFAEHRNGSWSETGTFPYNNLEYSVTDPSVSSDGSVLYFSSDMKGGKGGKDLYRSQNFNGKWTKPINLGDINTAYDEVAPYIAPNQILYFSSNGHAGLGGLDIFKIPVTNQGFGELQNPGYPLNTHGDEFSIVIDSLNTHGYLSSNRKSGGNDDDIYEFDIDLQTYPLAIDGVVRHKEINWSDSAQLMVMEHAKLSLVDNIRNVTVFECISDSNGNFRLEVPYFSTYKIKVTGQDNHENIVSLEIPKHRKSDGSRYEIVVIKDPFKVRPNEVPR